MITVISARYRAALLPLGPSVILSLPRVSGFAQTGRDQPRCSSARRVPSPQVTRGDAGVQVAEPEGVDRPVAAYLRGRPQSGVTPWR